MEMRFGVGAVCCEAQDIFIPEQAVQNGVGIQVEQFIALQAPCQDGKALKMRFCAWFVMVTRMRPFFRQALRCAFRRTWVSKTYIVSAFVNPLAHFLGLRQNQLTPANSVTQNVGLCYN